jgi:hypothetical protein
MDVERALMPEAQGHSQLDQPLPLPDGRGVASRRYSTGEGPPSD